MVGGNVPESSRMVQNVLEYSRILCYVLVFSGMFWYDMLCSGVFLNVLEGSEKFPGWWWVVGGML